MTPPPARRTGGTRTIRVDNEVWAHIQRQRTGPADRPGDVLRRLFGLPPAAPAPAVGPRPGDFLVHAQAARYALHAVADQQHGPITADGSGCERSRPGEAGEAEDLARQLAAAAERGLARTIGQTGRVQGEAAQRAVRLAAYFAARAVTPVHSPLEADRVAKGIRRLAAMPDHQRARILHRAAEHAAALTHHEPPGTGPA